MPMRDKPWRTNPPSAMLVLVAGMVLTLGAACSTGTDEHTVGLMTRIASLEPLVAEFESDLEGLLGGARVELVYPGLPTDDNTLEQQAAQLVSGGVDLIVAWGTPATLAAMDAVGGDDTPLLFGAVTDPVGSGIVSDLTERSEERSGVGAFTNPKAFEFLVQAAGAGRILTFHAPDDAVSIVALRQTREAAASLGVELIVREAGDREEMEAALDGIPPDVDAIFQLSSRALADHLDLVVDRALEQGLPVGVSQAELREAPGVLTAAALSPEALVTQLARQAAAVLTGTSPRSIPVEANELLFSVNTETAHRLGLTIPDSVLARVDVIYGQ